MEDDYSAELESTKKLTSKIGLSQYLKGGQKRQKDQSAEEETEADTD